MFRNWSGVNNSEPLLWAIKSGIEIISITEQRTLDVIQGYPFENQQTKRYDSLSWWEIEC